MINFNLETLENNDKNVELYHQLYDNTNKESLSNISNDIHLYRINDQLFCLDNERQQVIFVIQYGFGHYHKFDHYVNNLFTWSMPDVHELNKLGSKLFFNYILKYLEIVMLEPMDGWDGKRFFLDRVMEAYKFRYNVYYMNFHSHKLELIDRHRWSFFVRQCPAVWAPINDEEHKRVIITSRNLIL